MRNWRLLLIVFFFLALGFGLTTRLAILQIADHGFYRALAQGQQSLPRIAVGNRGDIFFVDKKGTLYTVATTKKQPFVFVTPVEVEQKEETAAILAAILDVQKDFVIEKLSKEESLFEVVKKQLSLEETYELQKLVLPGVYIQQESIRSYPHGALASRTLGFVNQDWEGQYAIEKYYEEHLKGKEGLERTVRNVAGYLLSENKDTLQHGKDLVLTIDFNIQSMAESLLLKAKELHNIEEGTIIVIDPMDGSILTLANYPNFDPNTYSEVADFGVFQNPAVQKLFEPGSVFKPITMASGIDAGKITPSTTYQDQGVVRIGGYKVLNYDERVWGERTMTEVLEYSINTGAVFAEAETGHATFLEYLERFGIFKPTKVDIAGEIYSANKELKKGYEITYATASFGQGIEMTAMQLLRAYSALANGGYLPTPHLLKQDMPLSAPIISERTASQVTAMLVSVTENGFAKSARVPGYYLAGKTGTAQISYSALGVEKPGYSDETVQSFIGYAPAFTPRFLALVTLKNPQTKTAEYSAIPLFQELAKYILDYYEVPHDYGE
ncbi:penicillin-binding protein 2 [Patescibacteria group bacterium]|nr:penicillin-binding protein 2 [Patescibacteria group bacterium]